MTSSKFVRPQLFWSCAIACALLALSAAPALADVKTRDKGQVKFEGMLGTMMRMFRTGNRSWPHAPAGPSAIAAASAATPIIQRRVFPSRNDLLLFMGSSADRICP